MRQVIFLSFYCKVYKKNPIIRLYVGDVMIDEVEIPEYTDNLFEKMLTGNFIIDPNSDLFLNPYKKHKLESIPKEFNLRFNSFEKMCHTDNKILPHPKFFTYIIDDDLFKYQNKSISIEILNSDSDYNNGFLKRSTLLLIHSFYIIPEAFLKNPIAITERYLKKYSRATTKDDVAKLKNYYKKIKWPLNLFNFFKNEETNLPVYTMGGNKKIIIKLKKKFNILWPLEKHQKIGFFEMYHIHVRYLIVTFLHKYYQYENQ